jgi:hypothetical protein
LWEGVKAAGGVAFRTHTQPWRRVYYDVADEVGLLLTIEGAVFNDALEASDLTLAWTLTVGGQVVDRGEQALSLGSAGQRMLNVTLAVHDVAQRTDAARLLANLLDYLDHFQPVQRKLAVMSGTGEYRARLRDFGLSFDVLAGRADTGDLSDYALLLCRGTVGNAAGGASGRWPVQTHARVHQ